MNLECKLPRQTPGEVLEAIADGLNDLEYWTPCDVAPLLASELIRRVEAPYGGYYYEITETGFKLLAARERIACTGAIA